MEVRRLKGEPDVLSDLRPELREALRSMNFDQRLEAARIARKEALAARDQPIANAAPPLHPPEEAPREYDRLGVVAVAGVLLMIGAIVATTVVFRHAPLIFSTEPLPQRQTPVDGPNAGLSTPRATLAAANATTFPRPTALQAPGALIAPQPEPRTGSIQPPLSRAVKSTVSQTLPLPDVVDTPLLSQRSSVRPDATKSVSVPNQPQSAVTEVPDFSPAQTVERAQVVRLAAAGGPPPAPRVQTASPVLPVSNAPHSAILHLYLPSRSARAEHLSTQLGGAGFDVSASNVVGHNIETDEVRYGDPADRAVALAVARVVGATPRLVSAPRWPSGTVELWVSGTIRPSGSVQVVSALSPSQSPRPVAAQR